MLSKRMNRFKNDKFIHLSSLGIEKALDSEYAKSKLNGEKKIAQNFKNSIIIKPSIVYSVDDKFTTNFMAKFTANFTTRFTAKFTRDFTTNCF